ncbi:class I SAM-dependent methyltransferase [Robiginitalea sp. M39]|uniref:Class I SAM-dependent methyltransferase n=2 Tax=Robiginitalea aurantiaca TaxID=3056915 RepID=A0ABT7WBL8_9FLAO|nr:class I SAM-dependent methyltransferase [Robiginitalea aurantiaca]
MKNRLKSLLIRSLTATLGNFLVFIQPKKARELAKNRITLVHKNKKHMSIAERLMRAALVRKLEKIDDYNTIAESNRDFWINNATELFEETEDGFETNFLPKSTFIFDLLKNEIADQTESFDTLVEIGTGNGNTLNYLSSAFPALKRLIGIDLSPDQIEINKRKFKGNNRLEFVAEDAMEWVKEHGHGNTIFFSNESLEYFLETQLQGFLNEVNQLGKIIFITIEPNGHYHDLSTTPHSQLYGNEPSFSHNYPLLFKNAGFKLWHFSQKPWIGGFDMQTFVGAKNF